MFAGLGQKITDNFGEAKLLDDIIDHWDAGNAASLHSTTTVDVQSTAVSLCKLIAFD